MLKLYLRRPEYCQVKFGKELQAKLSRPLNAQILDSSRILHIDMTSDTRFLAEQIWHYHQMNHRVEKADAILVLCSHDKRVAERGAELFIEGWAPLLIFSGGLGAITSEMWIESEADQFAAVAVDLGVPMEKILIENHSRENTDRKQVNEHRREYFVYEISPRREKARSGKVYPGAEALYGTQSLCNLQKVLAREEGACHFTASIVCRISK